MLNQGAEEVARGNLDVVVPEQGPEELAELARHFNHMTARLREAGPSGPRSSRPAATSSWPWVMICARRSPPCR